MAKNTPILETVRRLIELAEHPNTPEHEREIAQMQASKLMTKHAIDEVLLNATRTKAEREAPTSKEIPLGDGEHARFWPVLQAILGGVARANRCRAVVNWNTRVVTVVGFAEDVEWTEILFTSIYFGFLSKINPHWDKSLDYDNNVYNFKVAGFKWAEINEIAVANGEESAEVLRETRIWRYALGDYETTMVGTGKMSGRLIAAYKRHAKKIGDNNPVRTQSFQAYRDQYTDAFQATIMRRLQRMEEESEQDYKSSGAELAIIDRREDVDGFFFDLFPHLSPEEQRKRQEAIREDAERARKAEEERIAAMTPKQREAHYAKLEREREAAARRDRNYWKKQSRKYDASAHRRGRAAAEAVNLSRSTRVDGSSSGGSIER